MDAAPIPIPVTAPATPPPTALKAWPRSAQLTTAFLSGIAATLIAVQACRYAGLGSRPTEIQRDAIAARRVDLNRADRAELRQLPGVGEGLADRIEDHRRERGEFRNVDELRQVKGVGPATLERLRPYVATNAGSESTDERPVAKPADSKSPRVIGAKKIASLTAPIDINRATATELQKLPGIGPKMSQRIVDERQKSPFKAINDLRRVSGIGPKTLERLRPFVTVGATREEFLAKAQREEKSAKKKEDGHDRE